MDKLKVAVIGCGRICVMHFDAIANIDSVELVACCDIDKDKADFYAKKYSVKAYYDYKDMLDNEQLDSIHICLPHYLHTIVAEYAFNKGVNVLSEKPMSIDYQSAVNAVECAKKNNVLYGVIFQCRYNNSIRKVKEVVKSGKLGKILSANAVLTWKRTNEYYTHSDWIGTWDKEGGGVIINQAIHTVDLVNWIVDSEIKKVNCSISNYCNDIIAVEDTAEGCVEYKNGTRFTFYFTNNYACDEPIQIKLFCENGNVVFGYDDAYIYYNDGTTDEAHQDNLRVVEGGKNYWGFQHIRQITQYYKALHKEQPLEISAEECLKTHKLICELYSKGKERFYK